MYVYCIRELGLDIEKVNANNFYKDWIRTCELEARRRMLSGNR